MRRARHLIGAVAVLAIVLSGCSGHMDRAIERTRAAQASQAAEEVSQGASAEAPSDAADSAETEGDTGEGTAGEDSAGENATSEDAADEGIPGESTTDQGRSPQTPATPLDPDRPEAQKPPAPSQLHQDGMGAAIAVAKYFLHLSPYMYATGASEEFQALSMPGCEFCEDSAKEAAAIKDAGGQIAGGLVDLEMIGAGGPYQNNSYMVEFEATFHAITEYRDGEVYQQAPTAKFHSLEIALSFDGEKWQVIGVIFDGQGDGDPGQGESRGRKGGGEGQG